MRRQAIALLVAVVCGANLVVHADQTGVRPPTVALTPAPVPAAADNSQAPVNAAEDARRILEVGRNDVLRDAHLAEESRLQAQQEAVKRDAAAAAAQAENLAKLKAATDASLASMKQMLDKAKADADARAAAQTAAFESFCKQLQDIVGKDLGAQEQKTQRALAASAAAMQQDIAARLGVQNAAVATNLDAARKEFAAAKADADAGNASARATSAGADKRIADAEARLNQALAGLDGKINTSIGSALAVQDHRVGVALGDAKSAQMAADKLDHDVRDLVANQVAASRAALDRLDATAAALRAEATANSKAANDQVAQLQRDGQARQLAADAALAKVDAKVTALGDPGKRIDDLSSTVRQGLANAATASDLAGAKQQLDNLQAAAGKVPTAADLAAMKQQVDGVQAALAKVATADDVAGLEKKLEGLQASNGQAATATDLAVVKQQVDSMQGSLTKAAAAGREEAAKLVADSSQALAGTVEASVLKKVDTRLGEARAADTDAAQLAALNDSMKSVQADVSTLKNGQTSVKNYDDSDLRQQLQIVGKRIDGLAAQPMPDKDAIKREVLAAVEARLAAAGASQPAGQLQQQLADIQKANDRGREVILAEVSRAVDAKFDATAQLVQQQNDELRRKVQDLQARLGSSDDTPAPRRVAIAAPKAATDADADGMSRYSVFHIFADEASARRVYHDLSGKSVADIALAKTREGSFEIFAGEYGSAGEAGERRTALRKVSGIDFSVAPLQN